MHNKSTRNCNEEVNCMYERHCCVCECVTICVCESENVKLSNVLGECIVSSKLLFHIDLKDLKLFVSHRGTNNSKSHFTSFGTILIKIYAKVLK